MLLPNRCPLPDLIAWCRALRHGLDVGLSPVKIFRQQAISGPRIFREIAKDLADRMADGQSLADSFAPYAYRFPPLFIQMIRVGEDAGQLPRVFKSLEDHYVDVRSAQKKFLQALVWPAMSYVGAIMIIATLIMILGAITPLGGKPIDILGLGLTGTRGAMIFLIFMGAITVAIITTIEVVSRNAATRAKLEGFALRIPVLDGCVRAFALQRFCEASHMSIEAGLNADKMLKQSLRATANQSYMSEADRTSKLVRKGEEIYTTLASCPPHLFPVDFLGSVQVGEESGRLAEVMTKQAEFYREEAIRKMNMLASIASYAVYGMVAILVIVMIFRIVTVAYLNPLNDAINST